MKKGYGYQRKDIVWVRDFIQEGGTVTVNGGNLVVEGNYQIESKRETEGTDVYGKSRGTLIMTDNEDYVKVKGNFVQGSIASHKSKLTAGTLEVQGNFTQKQYVSYENFAAGGTHKVLLSGEEKQEVNFANTGIGYSYFAGLEITNESEEGVVFGGNRAMAAGAVNDHGNKTSGYLMLVKTTTFENHTFHGNLYYTESMTTPEELTVTGNVTIGNRVYLGADFAVGKDLTIASDLELNGNQLEVDGNIHHTSGTFFIDGGKAVCQGDYTVGDNWYTYNYLRMTNSADYFCVNGNVLMNNRYSYRDFLTAGTWEIKGDFTQKTSINSSNCMAGGTHTTIFSGSKKQTIRFDSVNSYLNIVELRNTSEEGIYSDTTIHANQLINYGSKISYGNHSVSGWTLTDDMVIEDDLYIADGTMDLNGHNLTVNGNLILGAGELKINGGFLNVTKDVRIQGENISGENSSYTVSSGILVMTQEKDMVCVGGDFVFQSNADHTDCLLAGTLEVKGDVYQYNANGTFASAQQHTLKLSGLDTQIVSFASSSASTNRIANIVIKNTSSKKVKINSVVYVTGTVTDESGNIAGSGSVYIGKLSQLAGSNYSGNVTLTAANTCEEDFTIGGTFTLENGLDVNGKAVKARNINITSGIFRVNGGKIQCSSNFTMSGYSYLVMTNALDYIIVGGDFSTSSGYTHKGYLTNGVLEVKGDFTQIGGNSYNFCATDAHKVILSGKSRNCRQKVYAGHSLWKCRGF